MSYSASPGPLTTIFTPPAGCFNPLPLTWSNCNGDPSDTAKRCFWALPDHCYPPGAAISLSAFEDAPGSFPIAYAYSPGVLPVGFTTIAYSESADFGGGAVTGCLSGWRINNFPEGFCTTNIVDGLRLPGSYSAAVETEDFLGLLPKIVVSWEPSELSRFTPASAPVLPTASLLAYEASVSAYKRTKAIATTKHVTKTNTFSTTVTATNTILSTCVAVVTSSQKGQGSTYPVACASPESGHLSKTESGLIALAVILVVGAICGVAVLRAVLRRNRRKLDESEKELRAERQLRAREEGPGGLGGPDSD